MTRKDLTDITVVLDRSGSMSSCRDDAVGGLNAFVDEQKKQPGEALFTLVQFDTEYEFVHKGIPIKDVPKCDLHPRGSTALLDAVGRAIGETGQRLAAMPDDQRPGLVVFVILTDGQENASLEFTKTKVKELITEQTDKWKWNFMYLGANQDAFAEGGGMGIGLAFAGNYSPQNTKRAYSNASDGTSRMRAAALAGKSDKEIKTSGGFTEEERKAMS